MFYMFASDRTIVIVEWTRKRPSFTKVSQGEKSLDSVELVETEVLLKRSRDVQDNSQVPRDNTQLSRLQLTFDVIKS